MKRLVYIILTLSIIFSSSVFALEGVSDGGEVIHVATVDGALLFRIGGATERDRPACATSGRFAAPDKSGHAAAILTAFSTGKPLANVRGTGNCTLWGNSEDIRWIEVCPINGCQ